ncbi:hypothetical protein CK820_G0022591 [Pan troglodytes]|uniref:Uncharacterized protein n=1 Tax=Pan troglodytes TaxID=9598 RepID=A0A2J8M9H3_PANTR|nr:hypothetical protein CK820_G0022591 [Pan troglodytes]
MILEDTGFLHFDVRLVSNSRPQVIHPPRPPKVLALQASQEGWKRDVEGKELPLKNMTRKLNMSLLLTSH